MAGSFATAHFTGREVSPRHWVIHHQGGKGYIKNPEALKELRTSIAPSFMGITGVEARGLAFQMVIDVAEPDKPAEISMIASPRPLLFHPQDWRGADQYWEVPENGSRKGFLAACVEAAGKGEKSTIYGNQVFYPLNHGTGDMKVFGAEYLLPRSAIHFLMMTTVISDSLFAKDFSDELWIKLFHGAYAALEANGFEHRPTRLIAGCGKGIVHTPHLSVHNYSGHMPFLFASQYGFVVDKNGKIEAPAGSKAHMQAIGMIQRRLVALGNSPEAMKQREILNEMIFAALEPLALGHSFDIYQMYDYLAQLERDAMRKREIQYMMERASDGNKSS